MEDSFELRVKRLFGSQLFESVPRSSFPPSSWSVVDGEVERREWNRERGLGPDRSEDPCSSAFADGGCFAKKRNARRSSTEDFELDFDDLDDDIDAGDRRNDDDEEERRGDDHVEATEIRASIGLDPTLDNEDEEDEYDRAALGGGASERLYMSDVKNHGPHLNYHSIFENVEDDPYNGSHHFHKDPRADHLAAGMRIEEDQKAAENYPVPNYGNADAAIEDIQLKPILKRKEQLHDDSKPKKRVRFDHAANGDNDLNPTTVDPNSIVFNNESTLLPDYIRNPSKYTCYTFEDYEDNDLANKRAYEDFANLHEKSNSEQPQQHMEEELPKSITFNPRRKSVDVVPVTRDSREAQESYLGVSRSTGIAAGESFGVGRIDEDPPEETPMDMETPSENERVGSLRRGRQYRAMAASDV